MKYRIPKINIAINLFILIILIFLMLSLSVGMLAQEQGSPEADKESSYTHREELKSSAPRETNNSPQSSFSAEKEYEFLKDQTIAFQDQVERERSHFVEFVEKYLIIVGSMVAMAAAIFFYFFSRTMKGAKEVIDDLVEEYFNTQVRKSTKGLYKGIQLIAERVLREHEPLRKKILILKPRPENDTGFGDYEHGLLAKRGFEFIDQISCDSEARLGNYSLVIFDYHDTNDIEKLNKAINQLNDINIPLIVYHNGRVNLTNVQQYRLLTFANTPLTLLNWAYMVLLTYQQIGDSNDS